MSDQVTHLRERLARPAETPRSRLNAAISALSEEEDRLAGLEVAQARSQDDSRQIATRLSVAEGEYTRQAKDPAVSLAYSYLNGDVLERRQDLAEASALVERIQSERSHQEEIDHELEAEIANVQRRISRARNNLTAALAEVVNSSEEVRAMLGQLQSAWATIRGIKKAFYHLADRLQGNMDGKLYSSFQVTPSLDPAVV